MALALTLSVAVVACDPDVSDPDPPAGDGQPRDLEEEDVEEEDVEEEAGEDEEDVLSEPVADFEAAPISPPYSADSPWNTPISDDPPVHPDSEQYTDRLGDELTSDTTQYTLPVHEVTQDTPTVPVEVVGLFSEVHENGASHVRQWERTVEAPIPEDAQPAAGSDGQIVVINTDTGDEWGFWQLEMTDGAWSATNGYRYNVRWNGVPPEGFGSRGAGVPYLTGLIRPFEIEQGAIEHAIAFAYPTPSPDHVFPATKSDGQGDEDLDLPEGARLQLDPSLGESDFDEMGLSEEARIIARALQEYGMILIDVSGRPKIYAEYEETAGWDDTILEDTVSGIPFSEFRVLDWDAYDWEPLAQPVADEVVPHGSTLVLEGADSYDPSGEIVGYEWSNADGDVLADGDDPRYQLDTAGLVPGLHLFSLRVENDEGRWSPPREVPAEVVATDDPFVVQTVEESSRDAGSVQLPEWEPEDDEALLVAVNLRRLNVDDDTEVEDVVGNGRSWERVVQRSDARGTIALEVWAAPPGATDPDSVDVRLSADRNVAAQAMRLSEGLEVSEATIDASDEDPTEEGGVALPDVAAGDLVVGFHAGRTEEFAVDGDAEPNALNTSVDDEGSSLTLSSVAQVAERDGEVRLSGRTRSPMDWLMAAIRLTPSG